MNSFFHNLYLRPSQKFRFLKPPASKGDTVHSSENVNEKVKLQIEESPIFLLVHIPHRTHDLVRSHHKSL